MRAIGLDISAAIVQTSAPWSKWSTPISSAGGTMRFRIIAAVALAAALATAASTATGSTYRSSAQQVVVWVMTDAQNGWPGAIAAANAQFQKQHPGVDVNIQYQSWDTVLTKFDAALAANDAPDVIELGNSQTAKYMAAGAFSAFYEPGQNWYASTTFAEDYGGHLAVQTKNGKWKGTIDSPRAVRGLTIFKSMVRKYSRASKTQDEAHPYPSIPFAKGRMAAFYGNGWEWPYVFNPKGGAAPKSFEKKMGAYPMPSHIKGRYMPTFLGGSDLGIPISAHHKTLGADWIKAFTSTKSETVIAKAGNIANTTTLANVNAHNPSLAPFARASKYSWFVPSAANWVNVENSHLLKTMMTKILTNQKSVQAATHSAAKQITQILNASS